MKKGLDTAIGIVAALFAAFGGFIPGIAPPEVPGLGLHTKFAIGLASMSALIVLLVIKALGSRFVPKGSIGLVWLLLGALSGLGFVVVGLNYNDQLGMRTFDHVMRADSNQTVRYISGTTYTPAAEKYVRTHPDTRPEELLRAGQTDDPTLIWTKESLVTAEGTLVRLYQIVVACLCTSIFSLLQLAGTRQRKQS